MRRWLLLLHGGLLLVQSTSAGSRLPTYGTCCIVFGPVGRAVAAHPCGTKSVAVVHAHMLSCSQGNGGFAVFTFQEHMRARAEPSVLAKFAATLRPAPFEEARTQAQHRHTDMLSKARMHSETRGSAAQDVVLESARRRAAEKAREQVAPNGAARVPPGGVHCA